MLFFVLCLGEMGLFIAVISLYRAAAKPSIWSFLTSVPGIVFLCSTISVIFAVIWTLRAFKSSSGYERKQFIMAIGMNLLTLILMVTSLELLIRTRVFRTESGETIFGATLLPRSWSGNLASYQTVLERMSNSSTFLIHDPMLGWTIAPSQRNTAGNYSSSTEGLRSPLPGISILQESTERPRTVRIALIGDSMTFGDEVSFEDTWGYALEAKLGRTIQILNYGVSGYGLNQAFLRYERDARPLKPQIVVVGITSEMIRRITSVYNFLIYPNATEVPFARPRYIQKDDTFSAINQPVPTPHEIYAHTSINELPFLAYDAYYRKSEWERPGIWVFLHKSYLFRFLISIHPPIELPGNAETSEGAMMSLSRQVIRTLAADIRKNGAIPLIIFLPYRWELPHKKQRESFVPLGVQMLRDSGLAYMNMTDCLVEGNAFNQFMPRTHYSPTANFLIAACLEHVLRATTDSIRMAERKSAGRTSSH